MVACYVCGGWENHRFELYINHGISRLEHQAMCGDCLRRLQRETSCIRCHDWPVPPEWPGIRERMCEECRLSRESSLVYTANCLAKRHHVPHTLSLPQWLYTLNIQFNGYCAYCLEKPYEVLEHFVPIKRGGGTTASNCVPACCSCNSLKYSWHPDMVIYKFPSGAIERVRSYLQQFQ